TYPFVRRVFLTKGYVPTVTFGINKNKADEMLRSIEKSYLKENTFISRELILIFCFCKVK
ncbi:MAG: hypothetical protein J6X94_03775, partial [Lachnospiraceae bacterium]|nr:hypothetical protein [Lachnospiraceae bacterium]